MRTQLFSESEVAILSERLSKRSQFDPSTGCLIWNGSRNSKGYGSLRFGPVPGVLWKAHRLSWVLHKWPIPQDLQVLHRCDNPPCLNHEHLFLGTNDDNRIDSVIKGRTNRHLPWACGERSASAKLTWPQVRTIRARAAAGDSDIVIASEFGVSPGNINFIRRGLTWREGS
jgi:HNH endonuclease